MERQPERIDRPQDESIRDLDPRDERSEVPSDEAESLKGGKVSVHDISVEE